jgi:predicted DNA-binding protein with PD1-like motif
VKFKKAGKRFILRIDKGEEIVENLKRFCKKQNIRLGTITGIGATSKATIGCFLADEKKYVSREFVGNYEMAPLIGNITTMDKEPYLHLHVNLCDERQRSFGGHLNSAVVSATCEVVIRVLKGRMDRAFSNEIGLNLFRM